MILVALSLLGAATVLFVLTPVLRPATAGEAAPTLDDVSREVEALEEKKLRLYAAIKDLDFEKDAGKVSEDDYQLARDDYLGQVAEILARLDVLEPSAPEPVKTPAKPKEKARSSKPAASSSHEASRQCGGCGRANPVAAKFCMACGRALDVACASCGTKLPDEAKFCLSCGKKVAS